MGIEAFTTEPVTELGSLYFDPMLSIIFSDADRHTPLRWLNKQAEEGLLRPDISITMIDQLKFGANLGFGQVKISQAACDNVKGLFAGIFCGWHNLLKKHRTATFWKPLLVSKFIASVF